MAKIIKVEDNAFGGNHPNGINKGYTKEIENLLSTPIVGEVYYFGSLRTSIVTEIVKEDDEEIVFKTMNSTYKITKNKKE